MDTEAEQSSQCARPLCTLTLCVVRHCAELMQTEMHHVRTLKIMLRVYVRELRDNLQLDSERLECIFPRLESLLELHTLFLMRLKERQRESLVSPGDRNYSINTVADVLIAQVSCRRAHNPNSYKVIWIHF